MGRRRIGADVQWDFVGLGKAEVVVRERCVNVFGTEATERQQDESSRRLGV